MKKIQLRPALIAINAEHSMPIGNVYSKPIRQGQPSATVAVVPSAHKIRRVTALHPVAVSISVHL